MLLNLFFSCSKLQRCVVEIQELRWDRHHWWQHMKATTLKQRVWTWMVRLPDSLCKHQQESELLWRLFCDAVSFHFRRAASDKRGCTIPVCALSEARTKWIQSGTWDSWGYAEILFVGHCWTIGRWCLCISMALCALLCRRQQHRMTTQESNHCLMPVWR